MAEQFEVDEREGLELESVAPDRAFAVIGYPLSASAREGEAAVLLLAYAGVPEAVVAQCEQQRVLAQHHVIVALEAIHDLLAKRQKWGQWCEAFGYDPHVLNAYFSRQRRLRAMYTSDAAGKTQRVAPYGDRTLPEERIVSYLAQVLQSDLFPLLWGPRLATWASTHTDRQAIRQRAAELSRLLLRVAYNEELGSYDDAR